MDENHNKFWQDYEYEVRKWLPDGKAKSAWFFRDGIIDPEKYRPEKRILP